MPAPVSTLGPGALTSSSASTKPVIRIPKKDVRRNVRRRDRGQRPTPTEIQIRNNGAGGEAATVAGYAGPGFHNWPSSHILQDTAPNPLPRSRSPLKKRSAPRPGSATHGYRNPNTKPPRRRPSRHCSRVRWPRFPHLALRPHRSNAGSKTPSSHLPQRGNAYQPWASPWEPHSKE